MVDQFAFQRQRLVAQAGGDDLGAQRCAGQPPRTMRGADPQAGVMPSQRVGYATRIAAEHGVVIEPGLAHGHRSGVGRLVGAGGAQAGTALASGRRRARAAATLVPASPAPMTSTCRAVNALGGVYQGVAARRLSSGGAAISPHSISRLRPKPGALRQVKPASRSPRLTTPAQVKVAKVAPGRLTLAIASNNSGCHMSGFLAGEKPSRNQASTRPSRRVRRSAASPKCRSRVTRSESHSRCTPLSGSGH